MKSDQVSNASNSKATGHSLDFERGAGGKKKHTDKILILWISVLRHFQTSVIENVDFVSVRVCACECSKSSSIDQRFHDTGHLILILLTLCLFELDDSVFA